MIDGFKTADGKLVNINENGEAVELVTVPKADLEKLKEDVVFLQEQEAIRLAEGMIKNV